MIKSRRMRWARHVACIGERRDVYRVLVGKHEAKKNEMGGACSVYRGRGEAYTGFWWGNLREKHHLEDPGIDGRAILRCIFRSGMRGMDWLDMVQDRVRWRAIVNAVMNLRDP